MKENNSENRTLEKITFIKDLGMTYPTESSKRKYRYGLYKCGFCGNEFRTNTYRVNVGLVKSCGCYQKQKTKEIHTKHGLKKSRLYTIWRNAKNRTLNLKHIQYNDYGGRGIIICDEWKNDPIAFYNWAMSNGYEENKGLSIDRIDNDGNYEPSNCRWTTQTIQARNQRIRKNNTSGYKGVSFHKNYKMFEARIHINKKCVRLGYFQTPVEAGVAYNNYIIENNLEGFILNEIPKEIK